MGLISENSIRRVQEANDILAVVESYGVRLKPRGANFVGLCPFHQEKTPSFHVNPKMQIFKCFGCDAKGGVIKFVQMMERCDFPEAVTQLARRAGIELEYEGGGKYSEAGGKDRYEALFWANRVACQYFEEMLADEREGRQARAYLQSRGFNAETIQIWRLGWAPNRWDGLLRRIERIAAEHGGGYKREKAIEVAVEAGVLRRKEGEEGGDRVYDAFRGRVMFPIFDSQNRVVGFGGRVLVEDPEAGGKYINTVDGPLFHKSRLLYGLNFAAKEIGLTKTAIVTEGYTDTAMCHQYGIRNVVATLGTALTRDHVRILRRYIGPEGKVIALFDADAAGEKATERAIDIFMEEDVSLLIVRGLAVKDACDYLPVYGAEAFRKVLEEATPSFVWALRRAFQGISAQDIDRRSAAVGRMMELVNRCPNAVKRELMRKEVAAVAEVPVESLPRSTPSFRSNGSSNGEAAKRHWIPIPRDGRRKGEIQRERRLLRYMIESADWARRIADEMPPEDFRDPPSAKIAAFCRDLWERGSRPNPANLLQETTDEEVRVILADLMDDQESPPLTNEELEEILRRFRHERVKEEIRELRGEIEKAVRAGDRDRIDRLLQTQHDLTRTIL